MADERLDDVMRRVISYDRRRVVKEYRRISDMLANYSPVLDLGCGSGTLLETLRGRGVEGVGVDASSTAVDACRSQGLNAIQADIFGFLERTLENSYGAAFAGHVLEHLEPGEGRRLFNLVYRALRPGGRFVLLTPNPRNIYVAGEGFWIDPTHVRPYPEPLIRSLALDAGFADHVVTRWMQGMPIRQTAAGFVRWLMTAGLHDPAPALLAVSTK